VSPTLIGAVVTILLAATIYTVAVFTERAAGVLKAWHLVLFWTGFIFDTTGTSLMGKIAGGLRFDVHGVLGGLAIVVMFAHSTWATVTLLRADDALLHRFHRYSLAVWTLWMVSLISGFGLAIPGMFGS
jgi:uncharacterized repeat protein (TIGR03987 family)